MRSFLSALLFVSFFAVSITAIAVAQESDTEKDLLFVTNQGEASVSIINMNTNEVVETVDLTAFGFSSNASPHHAVAEKDGSAWYVSMIAENTVLKLNSDDEVVSQGQMEAPGLLSIHPTKNYLFVARSMMAASPPQSLGMADRDDLATLEEVGVFFDRPHAVTTTADGRFVYSASLATNQFIGLDPETQRGELTAIDGSTHVLVQLASSPDGMQLAGTGQLSAALLLFDVEDDGRLTLTDEIEVGAQPWHPIYSPDGSRIYVPNKQGNSVSVVDVEQREVIHTIEGDAFAEPHGAALSADGRYLYVSNNHQRGMMEDMMRDMVAGAEQPAGSPRDHDDHHDDHDHHADHDHDEHDHDTDERPGTVAVIDTETFEVVQVIEVGVYPTGLGTQVR